MRQALFIHQCTSLLDCGFSNGVSTPHLVCQQINQRSIPSPKTLYRACEFDCVTPVSTASCDELLVSIVLRTNPSQTCCGWLPCVETCGTVKAFLADQLGQNIVLSSSCESRCQQYHPPTIRPSHSESRNCPSKFSAEVALRLSSLSKSQGLHHRPKA